MSDVGGVRGVAKFKTFTSGFQRRYDMRHKMLTQCALFCIDSNTKRAC